MSRRLPFRWQVKKMVFFALWSGARDRKESRRLSRAIGLPGGQASQWINERDRRRSGPVLPLVMANDTEGQGSALDCFAYGNMSSGRFDMNTDGCRRVPRNLGAE